eukprot:8458731-Lingulodinium_polyedra.AAC.1
MPCVSDVGIFFAVVTSSKTVLKTSRAARLEWLAQYGCEQGECPVLSARLRWQGDRARALGRYCYPADGHRWGP